MHRLHQRPPVDLKPQHDAGKSAVLTLAGSIGEILSSRVVLDLSYPKLFQNMTHPRCRVRWQTCCPYPDFSLLQRRHLHCGLESAASEMRVAAITRGAWATLEHLPLSCFLQSPRQRSLLRNRSGNGSSGVRDSGTHPVLASSPHVHCAISCSPPHRMAHFQKILRSRQLKRSLSVTRPPPKPVASCLAFRAAFLPQAPFSTGRSCGARGFSVARSPPTGAGTSLCHHHPSEASAEHCDRHGRQLCSSGTVGTFSLGRTSHIHGALETSSSEHVCDEAIADIPSSTESVTRQPYTPAQSSGGAEECVSPSSLFDGDIEEEDCPEDFLEGLYTSEIATHRHARIWLKPGLQSATHSLETNVCTDTLTGERQKTSRSGTAVPRADEGMLTRQNGVLRLVPFREETLERDRGSYSESSYHGEDDLWSEEQDDMEFFPTGSASLSSSKNAGYGSPGTTLLSRLALAEREALKIPHRRVGEEMYGQWSERLARIQEAVSGPDLRSLAVDRRHLAPADSERGTTLSEAGKRFGYSGTRTSKNQATVGSPRRMRVLDLDSVSPGILHHSFMFLLVKHFPAEVCLKVLSRIAVYRDLHTQLAYENLIRDMSFLFTKHYETCTSTPHDLGPTLVAYVCRIVQTLSIAWGVNYVRRFGCFSKQFIVKQIERSANPRLFDFVRYAHKGGVKPLPPIVTHPHRLSSYVRLLDESSSKFYMYTHLKRHKQLPLQQQLHASPNPQVEGAADTEESFLRLDNLASSPQGNGLEEESLLPRAFVAAEKALQPAKRSLARQTEAGGRSGSLNAVSSGRKQGRRKPHFICREKEETCYRPPIYDLILAAEHLGIDYRDLQRRIQEEQEDDWGSDDGDEGARELRDLVDNDEVYKHIRDRYFRSQDTACATRDGDRSDDEMQDSSEEETDSDVDSDDVDELLIEISPDKDAEAMAKPHGKRQKGYNTSGRPTSRAHADTGGDTASLAPGIRSTLRSSARLQTTRVAPSCLGSFGTAGSDPFEKQASADGETLECNASALVPTESDKKQWGWKWEFQQGGGRPRSFCATDEGDDDAAVAERWWGTSWGRNQTRFRYKGRSYGVVPGEGWKLLEDEGTLKLLRPKRRFGKHAPKRERRSMRRATLRRVRQQVLQHSPTATANGT
uniref:Uncharacterized protein n=1 Tax=Toxoplasma gondii COUG TaxID=1074873 RepID=A0A2G8XVY8_TOXGO|nr:hypothetical protein TGCOUG_215370 [Toxoplasma gondii COUG]